MIENGLFSEEGFQKWGKEKAVLFASITTQIEGRKDDTLLRNYGFGSFPSLAVLDAAGEAITKSMDRSLDGIQSAVESAAKYETLKPKVDAGEDYDKAEWYMARLGLEKLSVEEAKAEMRAADLDAFQEARAKATILGREVAAAFRSIRSDGIEAAAAKIHGFYKAGRQLPDDSPLAEPFYDLALRGAMAADDDLSFHNLAPKVVPSLEKQLAMGKQAAEKYREAGNDRMVARIEPRVTELESHLEKIRERMKKKDGAAKDGATKDGATKDGAAK